MKPRLSVRLTPKTIRKQFKVGSKWKWETFQIHVDERKLRRKARREKLGKFNLPEPIRIKQESWCSDLRALPPLPDYLAFFEHIKDCVVCGMKIKERYAPRRSHCLECFKDFIGREKFDRLLRHRRVMRELRKLAMHASLMNEVREYGSERH